MIIKTEEFKATCANILLAVDNNAANLELFTNNNALYLNVTNREYYCSCKFMLESTEDFHAVVDASLFLNLIAGITAPTFDLTIKDNTVVVKVGKSNYKLAMIYENENIMTLPVIKLGNKTVEMMISNDILKSILNINSKEILKGKNIVDITELQKLYYITEEGCFTFTTGACLNAFKLDKPVQMLLNDRIVKLFKLFKDNVHFSFGYDALPSGTLQTKVVFQTDSVYLAAIITNDDILLNKVRGPYLATKGYIENQYDYHVVLSTAQTSAAISRLMLFTKNSIDKVNMMSIPVTVTLHDSDVSITDKFGNTEVLTAENGSYVADDYTMVINLADLKLIFDYCKEDHITLNCGDHRSVVMVRNNISNLIPEGEQKDNG